MMAEFLVAALVLVLFIQAHCQPVISQWDTRTEQLSFSCQYKMPVVKREIVGYPESKSPLTLSTKRENIFIIWCK